MWMNLSGIPNGLEGDERQEALAEFIANMHADPGSSDAFDEFREELEYDESDWLDDEDLDRMSSIENTYDVTWPHWSSAGSGESALKMWPTSFKMLLAVMSRPAVVITAAELNVPAQKACTTLWNLMAVWIPTTATIKAWSS
jgi:hypothetical protein